MWRRSCVGRAWPPAGSVCATPIISMDYFPTLLEAAGRSAKSEKTIDGVSLVPLLRGQSIPERTLYWDYPHYGEQGGKPASARPRREVEIDRMARGWSFGVI